MVARWISILDEYDFDIQFRKGTQHSNADGLSRIPARKCKKDDCKQCFPDSIVQSQTEENANCRICNRIHPGSCPAVMTEENSLLNTIVCSVIDNTPDQNLDPNWLDFWSMEEIKNMQEEDPAIGDMLRLKNNQDEKPLRIDILNLHPEAKVLWGMWENLEVKDDILYKQFLREDNTILLQLVAPQKIRETIFHQLHHNKIAGHFGKDRTINAIRTRFYWPRSTENIKLWCLECDLCARCKPGPGVGKSPLRQSKSSAPLERINVDIVGPLPVTANGNEYIIVLGDYYSKWKEAFPVPNHTAMTVADKIITEFICRFGCPLQLHTDQGKEFESHLFKIMCEKLGVQKTHSTPYRPQSSGLVERYNRTLKQMLSMFVNEHRNDWDEHIPYLMMAYRSTVHSTTKCTPNSLMLGREIRCPVDLMFGLPNTVNDFCQIEYVEWVKNTMREAYKNVYDHSGQAAQRQKLYYDRGLKVRKFEPNCWVWRWYPPKVNQTLGLGWTGPYLVIEKITDVTYKIQKSEQTKSIMVHVDHLKPYLGRNEPNNWVLNNTLNISHQSDESLNLDMSVGQALTPVVYTPERQITKTRIGRTVRPRDIYSP
ncbi:unnamed protein product [Mytilus edulis]|uniref:Integrase catalytic domain-containing protein n=1 Tax=Mytilus edulis TaxID=6550 RepID=A0A8S3T1M3_MYTED|nr:unnamed protein product [Mytilus edulis]